MKIIKDYLLVCKYYILILGLFVIFPLHAQDARFTVVLDAGHGGHDPGAMSANSKEKDINLAIVLDLGAIIEQKFKDVKVVYTRKTDKYLTLQERADVVNDHHADLFICIHTNASLSPSAYGAETFTLGLAKSKANLDVAMRENSVILLEEDYKTKYKGFDPKSVDSYIMFEFMQDKYIDKSVEFSSIIQKQFVSYSHRTDRGVRQAGFWVLHRSACPSVLVEVGFISNPPEERYLTSDQGQKEMATAVFNAFVDYKRMHDKKSGRQMSSVAKIVQPAAKEEEHIRKQISLPVDTPKQKEVVKPVAAVQQKPDVDTVFKKGKTETPITTSKNNAQTPVFKVQLFVSLKNIKAKSSDFKGVANTDYFVEDGLNKYTVGNETEYSNIEKIRKSVVAKFPKAFIIAFIGDKKISAREALKLKK
jgi:N-acetylmuramoyl-L-alanine amidase